MRTRSAYPCAGLHFLAAAAISPAAAQQGPPAHVHPKNHTEPLPAPAPAASGRVSTAATLGAAAPLTLGELELLVLERHPTLAQAAALVDISRARAFQAGLQSNPIVGTRSPSRTTSGVTYGADRPLMVKKLNSIDMVFGTVDPGRMAHSWIKRAKSLSTRGSWADRGWMMNSPAMPMPSCMGPWLW